MATDGSRDFFSRTPHRTAAMRASRCVPFRYASPAATVRRCAVPYLHCEQAWGMGGPQLKQIYK
eukprot:9622010-Alexandrium_andersonii.AAC.1